MEHDSSALAAYALGALGPDETREVDAHVAGCAECRAQLGELSELEAALGEVPPEAFLEGPPEGGDLLLRRTLREVRVQKARAGLARRLLVAAGVAALMVGGLVGGTVFGRATAPGQALPTATATVSAPATASGTASPTPSGVRTGAGSDPATGARMTVALTPAAGWVRVHVKAEGIKAGRRCVLQVVDRAGHRVQAGSWLVSPTGEQQGTALDGTALVAPADVASVDVVTVEGQRLVSVPVR
jgi:hypothetical protein